MNTAPSTLIVGAGPTGLATAAQLLRRGVTCRVIDDRTEDLVVSRAIGLSSRSLEIVGEFGAADALLERGNRVARTAFLAAGDRLGDVAMSSATGTRYPFMLALPQPEVEAVLTARVEELGGTIERGVSLTGFRQDAEAVHVECRDAAGATDTASYRWLVACDGAHSTVRKGLEIPFTGESTEVHFMIVDAVLTEQQVETEGQYHFSPAGLLVVIPLPDGRVRLGATLATTDVPEQALDRRAVQEIVDQRSGTSAVRIETMIDAGWGAARVVVNTRVAERYGAGRVFLAGDAAHVFSPVGGQGMNTGLQDAHNIAWKIAHVLTSGTEDHDLLASYELERRPAAIDVMKMTSAQTKIATVRMAAGQYLRNQVFSALTGRGGFGERVGPRLAQLTTKYPESALVAAKGAGGKLGERLPNVRIATDDADRQWLHDWIQPAGGYTAVAVAAPGDGPVTVPGDLRAAVPVVRVASSGDGNVAVPADDTFSETLGLKRAVLLLVRPDAHVAASVPADSPTATADLLRYLPGSAAAPREVPAAAAAHADRAR